MSSHPWLHPSSLRLLLPLVVLLLAACAGPGMVAGPPAAVGSAPEDASLRFRRMAASALAAGRARAAVMITARGLALAPGDPQLLRLRARALAASGRPGAAADVWRRLLARGERPFEDHQAYVRALVESGQTAAALAHLAALRPRFDALAAYWNARGIVLAHARRFQEAAAAFRAALTRRPAHPPYQANLALAVALAGDPAQARSLLMPLAEGLASDPRIRHNLALVEVLAGRPGAARRLLRIDLDDRAVAEDLAALLEATSARGRARLLTRLAAPPAAAAPLTTPQRPPPATALALTTADLAHGRLPVGDWFLRLGTAPDATTARRRWRALRRAHPTLLGDLLRLRDPDPGPRPLLVGPLTSPEEAERRCERLQAAGVDCTPLRL